MQNAKPCCYVPYCSHISIAANPNFPAFLNAAVMPFEIDFWLIKHLGCIL